MQTEKSTSQASSTSFLQAQPKTCPFHSEKAPAIDYKNVRLMRKFLSSYNKIQPRRRSGLCAKHQRQVANEIKKSRYMALVPFVMR